MNKPVRVILLGKADEKYNNLKKIQLLRSITQKFDFIKANLFYGDNIPKRKIPKSYDVQNLWRVELINHWRMLYTIKGDKEEIFCFVLDILDHKEYDKLFGYRKR